MFSTAVLRLPMKHDVCNYRSRYLCILFLVAQRNNNSTFRYLDRTDSDRCEDAKIEFRPAAASRVVNSSTPASTNKQHRHRHRRHSSNYRPACAATATTATAADAASRQPPVRSLAAATAAAASTGAELLPLHGHLLC